MQPDAQLAVGEQTLRERLEHAELVALTMALVVLTGDFSLLEQLKPHVRGPWDHQISVPAELGGTIRDRAAREIASVLAGRRRQPSMEELGTEAMLAMMSVVAGESVDERYLPLLAEQIFAPAVPACPSARAVSPGTFRVVVIGAGAAGLCAAIRLQEAGIDYVVLEKNADVGGTWYENRYPGCAVDLPSHLYEYSFEPNPDWPRYYARQESVREYLARCADKYDVRRHVRVGMEATSAIFDEMSQSWTVVARNIDGCPERFAADAVICAVGLLNRPALPDLPGLNEFRGRTLHSAAWPPDADLRGQRVALIGTGASGIQLAPAIADDVASLTIFQRSPTWAMRRSKIDREIGEGARWLMRHVPFYAAWYRFQQFWCFGDGLFEVLKVDPQWQDSGGTVSELNAKFRATMVRHIERELQGRPDLLAKAIPAYPPFGKRVLADTGWYRTLRRAHVALVDTPISRVEPDGIATRDGRSHPVDTIIFATGFHAGRMLWPMDIRGRGGRTIRQRWGDDNPRAYLGITVPDFPNLFVLYGPNSNFGHGGSAIFLAECQVHYVVELLRQMRCRGHRLAEVRNEVHDEYNALIDAKLKGLAWSVPSVRSWYRNSDGRVIINQPWSLLEYWQLTRAPDLADYRLDAPSSVQSGDCHVASMPNTGPGSRSQAT